MQLFIMAGSKKPKDPHLNCLRARWASRNQESQGFITRTTGFCLRISSATISSPFTIQPCFPTSKLAGSAGNPTLSTKKWPSSWATSLVFPLKPLSSASLLTREWKTLTMCLKLNLAKSTSLKLLCLISGRPGSSLKILKSSTDISERWRRRVPTLIFWQRASRTRRGRARAKSWRVRSSGARGSSWCMKKRRRIRKWLLITYIQTWSSTSSWTWRNEIYLLFLIFEP